MEAFKRENYGPGWALIGDAASYKDQITAMGITHAFRDAELIAKFINLAFIGEMTMKNAMFQYQHIRALDYNDYFNLVCTTAEMNNYSIEELKYFYSIKNNQTIIDQVISQFGDTLPVFAGQKFKLLADEFIPHNIKQFDPTKYAVSFPLI